MRNLNNAFQTEILKLKKNKMAFIGFIVTIFIPVLLVLKSVFIDKIKIDYHRSEERRVGKEC